VGAGAREAGTAVDTLALTRIMIHWHWRVHTGTDALAHCQAYAQHTYSKQTLAQWRRHCHTETGAGRVQTGGCCAASPAHGKGYATTAAAAAAAAAAA
jgi:hypothetical protein